MSEEHTRIGYAEILWQRAFEAVGQGQVPEHQVVVNLWLAQTERKMNLFTILGVELQSDGTPRDLVLWHCNELLEQCLRSFDNNRLRHILKLISHRCQELHHKGPKWLEQKW